MFAPPTATGLLRRIVERKRAEVAARRKTAGDLRAKAQAAGPVRDLAAALWRGAAARPRVIAEFKRASPSAGPIRPGADPGIIAADYAANGAAALSILTDEVDFDGALDHLAIARARVGLPLLRKDFIIDELQVLEARAAGADAVLLIVAILDDEALRRLLAAAAELGLAALVEVHDTGEAARAVAAGAAIVGVNARNLDTLEIDRTLFAYVRNRLPERILGVAESGIRDPEDVRALAAAGADAILVGEALMRQPSPGEALRQLLA
jgi:indole-3-glycerol phosphate synthase